MVKKNKVVLRDSLRTMLLMRVIPLVLIAILVISYIFVVMPFNSAVMQNTWYIESLPEDGYEDINIIYTDGSFVANGKEYPAGYVDADALILARTGYPKWLSEERVMFQPALFADIWDWTGGACVLLPIVGLIWAFSIFFYRKRNLVTFKQARAEGKIGWLDMFLIALAIALLIYVMLAMYFPLYG